MGTRDAAKHIQYTEHPHSKEGPVQSFNAWRSRNPEFDNKVSDIGIFQRKFLSFIFFFRFRSSLYTITGCFKLCSLPMTACLFSNLIHYAHRFPYSTPVFGFISSALKSRVCYMHGCVAEAGSKKKKRWVKKRREMRKQCSEFLCVLFQYGQDRHKTRG